MYNPNNDIPSKDNKKIAIIDFDTPLVKAALAVQESFITVTHNKTKWQHEFKNRTEFYGKTRAKDGGWIGLQNSKREASGKPKISSEEFTIEDGSRIVEDDFVAFGRLKNMLEMITNLPWVADYRILVGGDGNFRDNVGKITKYKGNRPSKPLRFEEVKSWVIRKYKKKIIQEDGVEADDVVGWYGKEGLDKAKITGVNPYVLCFVDKDLYQCEGWVLNYNKEELKCEYNDQFSAAKHFFCQMLAGDPTDCIIGLPNFTEDIVTKYGLKKTRGVGMKTAEAYLSGCETIKELASRVHEAYVSWYGSEPFKFEAYDGDTTVRTYKDMMEENATLLRMQSFKGHKYSIIDTLKRLGVING